MPTSSLQHFLVRALVLSAAGLLLSSQVFGQWSNDAAQNLVIADRPTGQAQPKMVPTADGGFYVSWFGGSGDGFSVYLQRLDRDGNALWDENGILVANRSYSSTEDYGLAIDDEGNALLAFRFQDGQGRNQALAQRVSPDGALLWGAPGVFASNDGSGVASPRIAPVAGGGAFVAWTSFSNGGIVVQKLNANGEVQWGSSGVPITLPSGVFFIGDLKASADGHVIVAGSAQLATFDRRLWAQKLSVEDGSFLWGSSPVQVMDGSAGVLQFGYFPSFVPDDDGGAVFAWYQVAGAAEARVRVQRVLSDGGIAFPANGVDVATGTTRQRGAPAATFDPGTGNIFVVWPEEEQIGAGPRTYAVTAQRIDPQGNRMWGNEGLTLVPMGDEQGSQVTAQIMPGGAVFGWSLGSSPAPMRLEAARVSADGSFVWDGDIVAIKVSPAANSRTVSGRSSLGYAAYVWAEGESGAASIKGQNVSAEGVLGPVGVDDPVAVVDPDELWFDMHGAEVLTASLVLSNEAAAGGADLTFTISIAGVDGPEDGTPLLMITPASGTVGAGESQELLVEVETLVDSDGQYEFEISIATNDPANELLVVPVVVVALASGSEGGGSGQDLVLEQSYPNPVSGIATIEFSLPLAGETNLEVFDLAGRRVATLVSGPLSAGRHRVAWATSELATGAYFLRLQSGDQTRILRALVIR